MSEHNMESNTDLALLQLQACRRTKSACQALIAHGAVHGAAALRELEIWVVAAGDERDSTYKVADAVKQLGDADIALQPSILQQASALKGLPSVVPCISTQASLGSTACSSRTGPIFCLSTSTPARTQSPYIAKVLKNFMYVFGTSW